MLGGSTAFRRWRWCWLVVTYDASCKMSFSHGTSDGPPVTWPPVSNQIVLVWKFLLFMCVHLYVYFAYCIIAQHSHVPRCRILISSGPHLHLLRFHGTSRCPFPNSLVPHSHPPVSHSHGISVARRNSYSVSCIDLGVSWKSWQRPCYMCCFWLNITCVIQRRILIFTVFLTEITTPNWW